MRGRSRHFHPHLPLVKKMLDSVSILWWLTSPTTHQLFSSLLTHLFLPLPSFLLPLLLNSLLHIYICLAPANIFNYFLALWITSYSLECIRPTPTLLKDSSANLEKLCFCLCLWIALKWQNIFIVFLYVMLGKKQPILPKVHSLKEIRQCEHLVTRKTSISSMHNVQSFSHVFELLLAWILPLKNLYCITYFWHFTNSKVLWVLKTDHDIGLTLLIALWLSRIKHNAEKC